MTRSNNSLIQNFEEYMQKTINHICRVYDIPNLCVLSSDELLIMFDDLQRFKKDPYALKQWFYRLLTDIVKAKLEKYNYHVFDLPTDTYSLMMFHDELLLLFTK
jgi:hypothetical protein